jgi:hypothetical protein
MAPSLTARTMKDYLTARDLGLTSLDITGKGQSAAPGWLNSMFNIGVAPQVSPTTGFISPEQQLQQNQSNANMQFGTQWLKNQIDASGDPIWRDVGGLMDQDLNFLRGVGQETLTSTAGSL